MIPWLPRFILVLAVLTAASPAQAQFVFTETNSDGVCGLDDYLELGLDTVWVWIDTNHDQNGSVVSCPTGEPLTIADYEICLMVSSYAQYNRPLTIGRWINKVPEFTESIGVHVEVEGFAKVHVYYSSNGATNHLTAGKRLLGGLEVTMMQNACNSAMVSSALEIGGTIYETSFYSDCPGSSGDNRIRLGNDFIGSCSGGPICSAVESTTWGQIKSRYR